MALANTKSLVGTETLLVFESRMGGVCHVSHVLCVCVTSSSGTCVWPASCGGGSAAADDADDDDAAAVSYVKSCKF